MPSRIVLCAHNKGGVGKTSLAVHCTGAFSVRSGRTLLVDCDDQHDAFTFFFDSAPEKLEIEEVDRRVSVIWNPDRKRLASVVDLEEFDNVVFDIDTPRATTAQVMVQEHPTLILVPVNLSQHQLAVRHLPPVLAMIGKIAATTDNVIVRLVPLGIPRRSLVAALLGLHGAMPINLHVAQEMPQLQESMQMCLKNGDYIWERRGKADLQEYFLDLLEEDL